MALGGLITDDRQRGTSGLPILSRIPIIGALFGSRSNVSRRTELLVLLTPSVIGSQAEARAVTAELRRRMTGLNVALPTEPAVRYPVPVPAPAPTRPQGPVPLPPPPKTP